MADALHIHADAPLEDAALEDRLIALVGEMTLSEKAGQLTQIHAGEPDAPSRHAERIRAGEVGAVINQVDPDVIDKLQRIAVDESRLGVPLIVGRDVIHGYRTIAPLPLGQAASWNPELVRRCAALSAAEARSDGIAWTFAPMLDICRDPRWGRIAECLGEDPYLAGELGAAMVDGFQGDSLDSDHALAACAKHFAGYGASESGRDYNTTNIPVNELRNVYLPPFRRALEAGCASVMTSFSDIDGVPATANAFLLDEVLRREWGFDGVVVSDWDAIDQLRVHGLSETTRDAAREAALAGVDMDMISNAYADHLPSLLNAGELSMAALDAKVMRVLRLKARIGLFDMPYARRTRPPAPGDALALVRQAALESLVLLKNDACALPLDPGRLQRLAVIGPLADAPAEQLGTWVFDGDASLSVTPLGALEACARGRFAVDFEPALKTSRDRSTNRFEAATEMARAADAAVLFLGEEAILSGEAHCRADIDPPGAQIALAEAVRQSGRPVIAVILAGRPLTLERLLPHVDAVLYAWHPGAMGGPAIADILLGVAAPSGKLPVTFPRHVGQIPAYYNHKNTGRPSRPDSLVHIDDIAVGAEQTSFGMTAFHLDYGVEPAFPFGFGLSYTQFAYADLELGGPEMSMDGSLRVSVRVSNTGERSGEETVQLYVRDRAGSLTRPVRELKAFRKIRLDPGETARVEFHLYADDLAFHGRDGRRRAEPGEFDLWIGGDSRASLGAAFTLTPA